MSKNSDASINLITLPKNLIVLDYDVKDKAIHVPYIYTEKEN